MPMKTMDDTPAMAKAVKPQSPLPEARSCPPSHGPKTAPKQPSGGPADRGHAIVRVGPDRDRRVDHRLGTVEEDAREEDHDHRHGHVHVDAQQEDTGGGEREPERGDAQTKPSAARPATSMPTMPPRLKTTTKDRAEPSS